MPSIALSNRTYNNNNIFLIPSGIRQYPTEQRSNEIEGGVVGVETKILEDSSEILTKTKVQIECSNEIVCWQVDGLDLIHNNFFELYQHMVQKYRNGKHKGIRWITSIHKGSENILTIFLNI